MNAEISKIENSGITPPMGCVRERRYKPNSVRTEIVEEIEKKVSELLKEDARAIKVEIVDEETDSKDIDDFAAEIENELPALSTKVPTSFDIVNLSTEKTIEPKKTAVKLSLESSQPIVKDHIKRPESPINKIETEIKAAIEIAQAEPIDSELLEIQNKIKEKEDLLAKALNPILKKRFEQAISELRKEYERKKKRLTVVNKIKLLEVSNEIMGYK